MNSFTSPNQLLAYRPWLDGLRAVAIILVFLEHTNKFKSYPLGPIGVGLFFALSGYLISGLLLSELNKSGQINLLSFYMKRLGRLMPGLFLSVFVCSLIFILLHMKRDAFNGIFALTYTTNFAAIYYGHHLSGFGHTWSLAVEEHFYIIWPLLMGYLFSRFKLKGLLIGSLSASLFVLVWRFFLDQIGINKIVFYLGTIERLDAIMYGCFVMFLLHDGWKPKIGHLLIGILLMALYAFKQVPLPNVLNSTVIGISGALIVCSIDSRVIPIVNDVLSSKIMVTLGLLSYSLYLWHLPIFKIVDTFISPSWINILVSIAITSIVACVSYFYFEMPLRGYFRRKYS
ncbi:acyltransferase [Methylophilus sp. QUAN]|uniref:acyltransferase family protein n=1 Tax=Methylophilus sp. QUAN TaxID=2781020 RepID=UPI0018903344|nr:acyltransferase [Methylophilus sp. QUAN]MBF4991763.1 acyltransferase [Methylophilus sp. QUAN]